MRKYIWILTIAALALIVWYANKIGLLGTALAGSAAAKTTGGTSTGTAAKTTTPAAAKSTFPMKYGDRGEPVKQLQQGLNGRFRANLVEDGIYGPKTQAALVANNFPQTLEFSNWLEVVGTDIYRNVVANMTK
jgi:hypothetical protein